MKTKSLIILIILYRDGSRTAATSKMEYFVIIINSFQPLTIITNHSTLDVAASPKSASALSVFFVFFFLNYRYPLQFHLIS